MKKFLDFIKSAGVLFALLFFIKNSQAQTDWNLNLQANTFLSSSEELPFWFYKNQRGRISDSTRFAGGLGGDVQFQFSERSKLEIAGNMFYDDGNAKEIFFDELYAKYNYSWLEIIAGKKHDPELFQGLSATNTNFAWSLNSRAMPGIQIQTSRPVYFDKKNTIGLEFSYEEYFLGKDRFVEDARLHSKSIFLSYRSSSEWTLKAGMSHYAQWGGNSPVYGKQPEDFSSYLRLISGREGGDNAIEGDRVNVIGNHLGVYELYVSKKFRQHKLQLIYNHFFEDGSGSRFANFPDGRYGLYYQPLNERAAISGVIYELYYTKNQSKNSTGPHKYDAYFNHFLTYNSGWSYKQRILGVPFFNFDNETGRITNAKFLAHHLGLTGNILFWQEWRPDYKLKLSYLNYSEANTSSDSFYFFGELGILEKPFTLKLNIGIDLHDESATVHGIGLRLMKSLPYSTF